MEYFSYVRNTAVKGDVSFSEQNSNNRDVIRTPHMAEEYAAIKVSVMSKR